MDKTEKVVNGFRFLPPSLGAWIAKEVVAFFGLTSQRYKNYSLTNQSFTAI